MIKPSRAPHIEELYSPMNVRAYSCDVTAALIDELRDEERVSIGPMVANRRAEFATARACARAAMGALGVEAAVPRREGGSPHWPDGMAGSISHTRGYCVSVSSLDQVALGIDVEEIARMSRGIEKRILGDVESAPLDDLDDDERRVRVATLFAAKESFYKAHYEVDARYLGFDAVTVSVGGQGDISFSPGSGAVSENILANTRGRAIIEAGRVVVGIRIDTSELAGALPSAT